MSSLDNKAKLNISNWQAGVPVGLGLTRPAMFGVLPKITDDSFRDQGRLVFQK